MLGVLALAASARAQTAEVDPGFDGGPVVVGTPRETWKGFELQRFSAALEFRMEYQNDELKQRGQPDQSTRAHRFREFVELSGEAIVGHRNLLDITGTVQLGWEDLYTRSDFDNFDGHDSNFLNLYDLSALAFGSSVLPTTIYARREQSLLDRAFAGTIDQQIMEEGVSIRYDSPVAPTIVTYFHRDESLEGNFGNVDTDVSQDTFSLVNGLVISDSQRLESSYIFDSIDETQGGGFSDNYNRHDVNLVHTLRFGEDNYPSELRSSLRYYGQDGLQEREDFRLDELLTLHHSERLESRYSLALRNLDVQGENQRFIRGEASVKYHLFDSLTTVARAGGLHLESPGDATTDEQFITLQNDYTKQVPYGRFDASGGVGFTAQQNSDRGSTIRVVDDPRIFRDGFPITLPRRNIVASSIVITPPGGFPVYQEGVDYTVQTFTNFTQINGVLGGGFVDGQLLLISYDVGPEQGSDVNSIATNISFRYTITEGMLQGLAVYTYYRTISHSISADTPEEFIFDDLDDLLVGIEYRIGGFESRVEYNDHNSEFDPYTLVRFRVAYSRRVNAGSTIAAEFMREEIDFESDNNRVTLNRGSLRWDSRIDRSLDWNVSLQYRGEDSSENGDTQAFDQSIGIAWRKRQTSIYVSFRNSFIDGPGSEQSSQYVQFGLRRTF